MLRTLAAAAVLIAGAAAAVAATDGEPESPVTAAVGIKTGIIPPVFAVPELVLHTPYVLLGVFGVGTPGGMLRGGAQYSLGGEIGYEFAEPGRNTPYLLGTILHYGASADASGRFERGDLLTLTAGYEWKSRHVELQLGAGLLFFLREERDPCTGWFCGLDITPPLLPALDLALRYRF